MSYDQSIITLVFHRSNKKQFLAVQSIKKQNLTEVKSMASPPAPVKLALESVCLLLNGVEPTDWKSIRQVLVKDGFILSIIKFNTDSIT